MEYTNIKKLRIVVLFSVIGLLHACASGSSIVTGKARLPIDSSQVQLYIEAPKEYEIIGIVKASSDSGWTEQGSQDYAVEELKKQAAKLGANGVLLTTTGESTTSIVGSYANGAIYTIPVTAQVITGKAVFVEE